MAISKSFSGLKATWAEETWDQLLLALEVSKVSRKKRIGSLNKFWEYNITEGLLGHFRLNINPSEKRTEQISHIFLSVRHGVLTRAAQASRFQKDTNFPVWHINLNMVTVKSASKPNSHRNQTMAEISADAPPDVQRL